MANAAAELMIPKRVAAQATLYVETGSLQAYAEDRLRAAAAYPKERLIRRDFRLAKLDLTAWFTSKRLADLCERSFVRRSESDSHAIRAEIYSMDAEAPGWPPPAQWSEDAGFSSREFERILAAGNRRGFYHHDAPSWQFYDRATSTGVQTLPNSIGVPPWELGSPFRLFLHWAYAGGGRRLTHAATLGLDGCGALIAGASGSGKSGTALAGLLNGLSSVGDDYVLVEQDSAVIAHSVFTLFKQDPQGLHRSGIPPSDIESAERNWHGKIEFNAARLSPKTFSDRMEIRALLIPEIALTRRTAIESASVRDAALALAPSAVFQLPGDTTEGFRFIANLVRRLPAFRVRLSENPAEIADAIGSFLAKG